MSYPIRNRIGSFPPELWEDEARIIDLIITSALALGYSISVTDGEETTLAKSRDRLAIHKEVGATDETYFTIYDQGGARLGWMWFVHGNRYHVLTDYVVNTKLDALVEAINPLVDMLENNA